MSGGERETRAAGCPDGLEMVEGVVHFEGVATTYLRCGRGPPLLFLMDPRGGSVRDDPVLRLLGRGFLVIAPLLPPGLSDPAIPAPGWLHGFVEGLGLESPAILYRSVHGVWPDPSPGCRAIDTPPTPSR